MAVGEGGEVRGHSALMSGLIAKRACGRLS